jgi:hypothetical protein
MVESFNRRKIMNAALGGAVAALWNGTAQASLPLPPPTPLDEYIEKYGYLIFTGHFNRVVATTLELTKKLLDPNAYIAPDELRIYDAAKVEEHGTVFFEIIDVDLKLINKNKVRLENIKSCKMKKIYCYGFDISGGDDRDIYYRNLLGSDVILFLSPGGHYGRNTMKFPEPFFVPVFAAGNWRDGLPLHISELERVIGIAKKAGYIEPPRGMCLKHK